MQGSEQGTRWLAENKAAALQAEASLGVPVGKSQTAPSGSAQCAASCPQPRGHCSLSLCQARAAGGAVTLQLAEEA